MRMRRGTPFEALRIEFGISTGTAHSYYVEMLKTFHEHVVPRLLRPLSAPEIDDITPADFKGDLPGAKFIVDLTGFRCKKKENVLLSRILWSAYHHTSECAAVFGETGIEQRSVCVFGIELIIPLQLSHRTDFLCIGPNSLAACRPRF